MAPMIALLTESHILKYIEQMIPALPVNGAIGIEGCTKAFGHNEMITRSGGIDQDLLP